MPVFWNLQPSNPLLAQVQNQDWYFKLPVWFAKQETEGLQYWSRWTNKYKKLKWQMNQGNLLQTVINEPAPVTRQNAIPANITSTTLTTVIAHYERSNAGRLKRQKFESFQFYFQPQMADFRTDNLVAAKDDIVKQIAVYSDNFTRWMAINYAPYIWVVGNTTAGESPYIPCVAGEATDSSSPKDAAFWAQMLGKVGAAGGGFLDYRNITALGSLCKDVAGIAPWTGVPGKPSENATMAGKYMLTGAGSVYKNLQFDTWVLDNRPIQMNLLNSAYKGAVGDDCIYNEEFYPLRFLVDGTFPDPEIEMEYPAVTYGSTFNFETVPNPDYVNAPGLISVYEGNQAHEDIDIGPPPAPFNKQNISEQKFAKMNWNGTVMLTDDLLINLGGGAYTTNKYGEFVQFISSVAMGIVPKTPRNLIPVVSRSNPLAPLSAPAV